MSLADKLKQLRLMIFDVDGVLSDGKIYLGPDGSEWRSSHVRDGLGLKQLKQAGITTAIISGRPAGGLQERFEKLGIEHLYFGRDDKLPLFEDLLGKLGLSPEQVGMMGDDTPDIPLITRCGVGFCPADAHPKVKQVADWAAPSTGGQGCAREVCDLIIEAQIS